MKYFQIAAEKTTFFPVISVIIIKSGWLYGRRLFNFKTGNGAPVNNFLISNVFDTDVFYMTNNYGN